MTKVKSFLMPEFSAEQIGPITIDECHLGTMTLNVVRPLAPDRLLDLDTVADAHLVDEYMPYWATVWPVAKYLAKAMAKFNWPPSLNGIELGCGLGLPGLVALAKGMKVVLTDYDASAVKFSALSAEKNQLSGGQFFNLDWRSLLNSSDSQDRELPEHPIKRATYDLVIASDLLYEERNVEPLVNVFNNLLTPEGGVLVADQNRPYATHFGEEAIRQGFSLKTHRFVEKDRSGHQVSGTLYGLARTSNLGASWVEDFFKTLLNQ